MRGLELRTVPRRLRRPQLALVALLVALAIGYAADALRDHGTAHPRASPSSAAVALSALPVQAAQTVALIDRGGPFPYPRNDGVVFDDNERLLPAEPSGYYHEYTVPTPGRRYPWRPPDHHRQARRVLLHQRSLRALPTSGPRPDDTA